MERIGMSCLHVYYFPYFFMEPSVIFNFLQRIARAEEAANISSAQSENVTSARKPEGVDAGMDEANSKVPALPITSSTMNTHSTTAINVETEQVSTNTLSASESASAAQSYSTPSLPCQYSSKRTTIVASSDSSSPCVDALSNLMVARTNNTHAEQYHHNEKHLKSMEQSQCNLSAPTPQVHFAWTDMEDSILLDLQEEYGNDWTEISLLLERTVDEVKSRWLSVHKERFTAFAKAKAATLQPSKPTEVACQSPAFQTTTGFPSSHGAAKETVAASKNMHHHDVLWLKRYNELITYLQSRQYAKNPKIARQYAKNPKIARWVQAQREQYKLRKDGKKSPMTDERITKLELIGFQWTRKLLAQNEVHEDKLQLSGTIRAVNVSQQDTRLKSTPNKKRQHVDDVMQRTGARHTNTHVNQHTQREKRAKPMEEQQCDASAVIEGIHIAWSGEEDCKLLDLQEEFGNDWTVISSRLPGRTNDEVKNRWLSVYKGSYTEQIRSEIHIAWTDMEDSILLDLQELYGNDWTEISYLLIGRTDDEVKSRWLSVHKERLTALATAKAATLQPSKPTEATGQSPAFQTTTGFPSSHGAVKKKATNQSYWDNVWLKRYNELVAYKKEKGDCNVPSQYAKNPKIGRCGWVQQQRLYYKWRKEGKKSFMTDERITKLELIGFQWRVNKDSGTQRNNYKL